MLLQTPWYGPNPKLINSTGNCYWFDWTDEKMPCSKKKKNKVEIFLPIEILSFNIQERNVHKQLRNTIFGLRHNWAYVYPFNVSLENNSWLLFVLKGHRGFTQFTRSMNRNILEITGITGKSFHWVSFFSHIILAHLSGSNYLFYQ